jgi:hypothetical protein
MKLLVLLFTLAAVVLIVLGTWYALKPVLLFTLAAVVVTVLATRYALRHTYRPRDTLAYYAGWGGYWHPIGLHRRITGEKADEIAAEGYAYLIGEFNARGQLVRVTKMLKGEVFFEYAYTYHDNGRLKTARVARGGWVKLLEHDERGRAPPGQRSAL